MDTILVRSASVWFIHIPGSESLPPTWLNLATVQTAYLDLSDDGDDTVLHLHFDNGAIRLFKNERAHVIIQELERISHGSSY